MEQNTTTYSFLDSNREYVKCIEYIQGTEYNILDWNYIKFVCNNIMCNPLNFPQLNSLYIEIAKKIADISFKSADPNICPYEMSKYTIFQMGVPFYYDQMRIHNLLFKFVLNCEFCTCSSSMCSFKAPVPDMRFYQNMVSNLKC